MSFHELSASPKYQFSYKISEFGKEKKKIQAFKPIFKIQETVEMKYNPKLEGNM